jgi:cytochrome P450
MVDCARNKARHAFLRRLISPSFSTAALRKFEPTMNEYYELLISTIENRVVENNGIVEMNELFHYLAFDVSHPHEC